MPKIDNEQFYISAIQKYGTTAKGVNWLSSTSQKTRFKVIMEFLQKDISNYTLIDAGCGFGDLYTYLKKKNNLPKNYIGVDALEDMYTIASETTGCEIIIADITKEEIPNADFVICSGAMNTLERFETHQFISNCFKASKIGFIFNILHGDKKSDTYNYFSADEIKQIAQDLKVSRVEFKTGYLDYDITVAFFHE